MIPTLSLVASLFVFWLLLSGYFQAFLISAGLGSAIAVALFARRMDVADREGHPIDRGFRALAYWPWLVLEIIKSGWAVTRIILDPRLPVSPTLVRFRPSQRTAVGLVTHANSITLTPGTLTVEASEKEFLVHGLTRDGAEGCVDSEMDRRVTHFEGTT
ncbi:MAG: cation transporter [Betaproteobacteria bacterium]|nr:cation transporter [Betaproteobacteria bacterium]